MRTFSQQLFLFSDVCVAQSWHEKGLLSVLSPASNQHVHISLWFSHLQWNHTKVIKHLTIFLQTFWMSHKCGAKDVSNIGKTMLWLTTWKSEELVAGKWWIHLQKMSNSNRASSQCGVFPPRNDIHFGDT